MAEITAQLVKDLREKSGAGMMDCKKALIESDGDMQKAMNLLRERGAAVASKRSSRATKEGLVASHITADHKVGALIELNCESDFVARNDDFKKLSADFAEHVAGLDTADGVLQSKLADGTVVADAVQNAMGKIGENIMLSRCERIAAGPNGFVHCYIHPPGRIGVLVEVAAAAGSADNKDLGEFAHDVAMHIAATAPLCVGRDEVPSAALDNEKEIFRKQALNEGKPEKIVDKIVEGRVQKYYADVVLLEQPFAKNPDQKVSEYMKQCAAKLGDDLAVKRFVRFRLGEKAEDTAAE